jgi:hypothetical protein
MTMPKIITSWYIQANAASICHTNVHHFYRMELPSVTGHGSIDIRKKQRKITVLLRVLLAGWVDSFRVIYKRCSL